MKEERIILVQGSMMARCGITKILLCNEVTLERFKSRVTLNLLFKVDNQIYKESLRRGMISEDASNMPITASTGLDGASPIIKI